MVTEADMERERQEARLKFRRDFTSALGAAIQDGFRQGFGPGWEKVYERYGQQHEWRRQIHVYQGLLQCPLFSEEYLWALPRDELERLAKQWADDFFTSDLPPSERWRNSD
jgi:hypothetical protein